MPREVVQSAPWDDVYFTRTYLGSVTSAKLDQGQLLYAELGGFPNYKEKDPYCNKYMPRGYYYFDGEKLAADFPSTINVFLTKKVECSNIVLLFCSPCYFTDMDGNMIRNNDTDEEFVVEAEFFDTNVLLYTEKEKYRDTICGLCKNFFDGVVCCGDNKVVSVPIEKAWYKSKLNSGMILKKKCLD